MTNPDIKQALGYVLCEPTHDGIKLSADGVDITEEIGGRGDGLSLVSGGGINITWDGSTEGRDSFELVAGLTLYKVADGFLSADDLDRAEVTNEGEVFTIKKEWFYIIDPDGFISAEGVVTSCRAGTYEGITVPSDGIYFAKGEAEGLVFTVTSLVKSAPSKLMQNGEDVTDEVKEAVGGGGATVVTFTFTDDGGVTADMTPAQVLTAMESGTVVGVAVGEDEGVSLRIPFGAANLLMGNGGDLKRVSVIFISYSSAGGIHISMAIIGDPETGWTIAV